MRFDGAKLGGDAHILVVLRDSADERRGALGGWGRGWPRGGFVAMAAAARAGGGCVQRRCVAGACRSSRGSGFRWLPAGSDFLLFHRVGKYGGRDFGN